MRYYCVMKKSLLRIFSLFMAINILFSSMGFAMREHQCKITKAKRYSLWQTPKDCCVKTKLSDSNVETQFIASKFIASEFVASDSNIKTPLMASLPKTTIKRTNCCKNATTLEKVSTNSSSFHKISLPNLHLVEIGFVEHYFNFDVINYVSSSFTQYRSNSPPPIWGKFLLIFIQVFRN